MKLANRSFSVISLFFGDAISTVRGLRRPKRIMCNFKIKLPISKLFPSVGYDTSSSSSSSHLMSTVGNSLCGLNEVYHCALRVICDRLFAIRQRKNYISFPRKIDTHNLSSNFAPWLAIDHAVATRKIPFLRSELLFELHVFACHHPHVGAHIAVLVLIPFVSKDNLSEDQGENSGRKTRTKAFFLNPFTTIMRKCDITGYRETFEEISETQQWMQLEKKTRKRTKSKGAHNKFIIICSIVPFCCTKGTGRSFTR